MKAKETFLEKNKKKSLLALLLLFLRQRKLLVLLFVLLLGASMLFMPSSWVTSFPGGARFAAGVAWIAGELGVDVSRWGIGSEGRRSYADLLEAFRHAKAGEGNGRGAGWGAFFGRGAGSGGAGTESSLDLVKGSRSDLEG